VGHDTVAASTVGTWLRSLTFGHIRQVDAVTEAALTRAWQGGAGPGDGPMFIDVGSTICEVHGDAKQGAAYGYTRQLGLHPLVATRADTGEILHARMRKGSAGSGRGAQRFVRETAGRLRRAGASGKLTLRSDSGFWSRKVSKARVDHDIAYTDGGTAQVAEAVWDNYRLIVRRTRIDNDPNLPVLFAGWRHP